jgi:hypothetical protein
MEENTKKVVMVVIVVACFALAGFIVYKNKSSGGAGGIPAGSMIWIKCNNPACGHEFQTDERGYLKFVKEKMLPALMTVPPMTCPKCSQESAYRAIKCEKCGKVFFPNTVQGKFDDICPGCGLSKLEERRKSGTVE